MGKFLYVLIIFLCFSSFAFSKNASGDQVFEKNGNIVYVDSKGVAVGLTDSGRDFEPVLHPNGKWVYFVRSFEGELKGEVYYPKNGNGPEDGILKMELWRIDIDGNNAKMLYQNKTAAIDHPSGYAYASLDNIQISPNGDRIYFETAHWVTSNALNVMDPDGSNVKMLGAGNETKIIASTMDSEKDYSGYIVTNQHRYYVFGPSYDWWWLYDPDWNEVGSLGPDFEIFTGNWDIKYTDGSEEQLTGKN